MLFRKNYLMGWLERAFIIVSVMIVLVTGGLAFTVYTDDAVRDAGPTGAVVWTKAICDDGNFCVDYLVTCENGQLVRIEKTPYSAQYGKEWEDPRGDEFKDWWC